MAHAYKKTLLAQLGFADADKQNPKHDLAVEYLALEHNSKRLIQSLHKGVTWELWESSKEPCGGSEAHPRGLRWVTRQLKSLGEAEREKPLTKGEGRYLSTVGFLDLVRAYHLVEQEHYTLDGGPPTTRSLDPELSSWRTVVVEVKASPLPTGDLLRQMKLYREHTAALKLAPILVQWVVAGCFKFSETQARALRQEGITPVSLGPLFDEWAERQRTDRTIATDIEEF